MKDNIKSKLITKFETVIGCSSDMFTSEQWNQFDVFCLLIKEIEGYIYTSEAHFADENAGVNIAMMIIREIREKGSNYGR